QDNLWPHAQESTQQAITLNARFTKPDTAKAELHTWLAWQEKPGIPYGQAITAKFLDSHVEEVAPFLQWISRLLNIPPKP
ncbi:MAG: hypothetical protein HQM12_23240, partial [SAR324 cluster bacterium]|nr:hypothetical protein [SAR324 cluster bacterium]